MVMLQTTPKCYCSLLWISMRDGFYVVEDIQGRNIWTRWDHNYDGKVIICTCGFYGIGKQAISKLPDIKKCERKSIRCQNEYECPLTVYLSPHDKNNSTKQYLKVVDHAVGIAVTAKSPMNKRIPVARYHSSPPYFNSSTCRITYCHYPWSALPTISLSKD